MSAIIAKIAAGYSSDYYLERRWHSTLLAFMAASALYLSALATSHLILLIVSMTCATAFVSGAFSVFCTMVSDYLKGNSAAGGIALIYSIGQLGGFFSPWIIGLTKTVTGSFQVGLSVMAGALLAGCAAIACNRL